MNICALIPARYKSTRLMGKPLLDINGKTMIQRTWEQTKKCKMLKEIYVVTDNNLIEEECKRIGANVITITKKCLNGTERICHALKELDNKYDIIVNVQGDEPFINPNDIDSAINEYIKNINNEEIVCSTLHYKITNQKELNNKNVGKLILDKFNRILYCSRALIPHNKSGDIIPDHEYFGHIGIFVFRRSYLHKFLEENTPAQLSEDIEWLVILEQGYKIISTCVKQGEISINTYDDYMYIKEKYKK
jgi:3-deoxy-manno-octulosonate cytidylyltransferase (CMP-KDO synthetase)